MIDFSFLPKSGREANLKGYKYFYTGLPCNHGHICPRYSAGGSCLYCSIEKSKKKNGRTFNGIGEIAIRNLTSERISIEEIITKKPDGAATTYIPKIPCKRGHMLRFVGSNNCVECNKESLARRKILSKYSRILREYGLTKEQYHGLVKLQNSSCAICGEYEEDHFKLHIDHCHENGK